jgi:NAD(P)H-hydrate repair Nnr-like enzyme with NAD(P)H-hydrate dehydratase domain
VVTADGRVQAWLIGSGIDPSARDDLTVEKLRRALGDDVPTIVDAGALDLVADSDSDAGRVTIITPHAGELARMIGVDRADILDDPGGWAARAADRWRVTVLLKGSTTHLADHAGTRLIVRSANPWLATAGTGDVLAGILGALVATNSDELSTGETSLARLGATACLIHGRAADAAGRTGEHGCAGPFVVLDLASAVTDVVRELIDR